MLEITLLQLLWCDTVRAYVLYPAYTARVCEDFWNIVPPDAVVPELIRVGDRLAAILAQHHPLGLEK